MELLIYLIILAYFLTGGVFFYLINRKKEWDVARKSYIKFIVYFIITNIIFFSIIFRSLVFHYLVISIVVIGSYELGRLYVRRQFQHTLFFILSLLVYLSLSAGLIALSLATENIILLTFIIISIFDSFSQISGQLFGKTRILPGISPNKTLEGLLGGIIISLLSAYLLKSLFPGNLSGLSVFVSGIVIFSFTGDILASLYKRKFSVKDYSNWIPGHGGFLDRFDSLIAGGAWAALATLILGI